MEAKSGDYRQDATAAEAAMHQEEIERRLQKMTDDISKDQKLASEQAEFIRAELATALETTKLALAEAHAARLAAEEASSKWRPGLQPMSLPTAEHLEQSKRRLGYKEGFYHFAVAGTAGSGKSSLLNALRGVSNGDDDAASTGFVETTLDIGRYSDPDPDLPFVWYDLPGAGTLTIPGAEYFNRQGIYIFDCVIVLFDSRFTEIDVAILQGCAHFKIPTCIVRSKSDQILKNIENDMPTAKKREMSSAGELRKHAKSKYTRMTQDNVDRELKKAQPPLSSQRVYKVSQSILCHLRREEISGDGEMVSKEDFEANIMDEVELLNDILADAKDRRPPKPKGTPHLPGKDLVKGVANALVAKIGLPHSRGGTSAQRTDSEKEYALINMAEAMP